MSYGNGKILKINSNTDFLIIIMLCELRGTPRLATYVLTSQEVHIFFPPQNWL
jgi:hypothetical protein